MGRFYAIALVIVGVLVLTPVAVLSRRAKDPFAGKTVLYTCYTSKIKSIDPATCGDTTSATMQGQLYESLYAYHYLKRPVELVPELAAAMPEITNDGRTYTIRLRPGIRYSRNACFGMEADAKTPRTRTVRAEDFVVAIKRIADFHLTTPLAWTFLSERVKGLDAYRKECEKYKEGDFKRYDLPVEGLRAVDELTLRLELIEPYPQLVHVLAIHCFAPIPRELVEYHLTTEPAPDGTRREMPLADRTAQITRREQVVGTGAFTLSEFDRGGRIVFTRNSEYDHGFYPTEGMPEDVAKGLLADAGKPLPFVDAMCYDFVEEDLPAWMGFLARRYDIGAIPPDVFTSVITPDHTLQESWKSKGIRLVTFTDPSVFWFAFNMQDPIVGGSKSLRQALCLAFNVEDYVKVLLNGRGRRAQNILPDSFPGHTETGPGRFYRYDLEAAVAKLEEAKRELAAKNLLDAKGNIPALTLDLGGRDELSRRMGEFSKQQFEKLGITVNIGLNDWPTLQQKVHNKQSQFYTMGWHADFPDPENFLQLFYGPNIEKGTNNSNYRNPEFDRLYDRIKVMSDTPERLALYVQMARIINEDCPVLLMAEPEAFMLVYDWVKNNKRHPVAYGMSKHVRVDAELRRRMGGR